MSEVRINTTRFGEITVDASKIIGFVEPIIGFDGYSHYVILDHSEGSPFKWLQSTQEPDLAFVVTNPKLFGIPYEFTISDVQVEKLGIETEEDALVLTIVNIPNDDPPRMTANLLGPVVIGQSSMRAMQVVLNDANYSTKVRLIPDELLGGGASASKATASSTMGE